MLLLRQMTALEMLDDDTYIGAENHFNLFTCRKVTLSLYLLMWLAHALHQYTNLLLRPRIS